MSQGIRIASGGRSRVVSSSSFKPSASLGKPSPSRVESGRPERFQTPRRTSVPPGTHSNQSLSGALPTALCPVDQQLLFHMSSPSVEVESLFTEDHFWRAPGGGSALEIPSILLRELPASKRPTGRDEATPEAAKHKANKSGRVGATNPAAAVPQSPWNVATQSQQSGSQVAPAASAPASLKLGSSCSSSQLGGNAPALGTSQSAPASAATAAGPHGPSATAPDGGVPGPGPAQPPVAPANVDERPDAAQQQDPGSEPGLAASTTIEAVGESSGSPGGPALDAAAGGSVEAAPRQQEQSVQPPADLVHVNPVDGQPRTPSAEAVPGRVASENNIILGSTAMPEGGKSLTETENAAPDQGAAAPS